MSLIYWPACLWAHSRRDFQCVQLTAAHTQLSATALHLCATQITTWLHEDLQEQKQKLITNLLTTKESQPSRIQTVIIPTYWTWEWISLERRSCVVPAEKTSRISRSWTRTSGMKCQKWRTEKSPLRQDPRTSRIPSWKSV